MIQNFVWDGFSPVEILKQICKFLEKEETISLTEDEKCLIFLKIGFIENQIKTGNPILQLSSLFL